MKLKLQQVTETHQVTDPKTNTRRQYDVTVRDRAGFVFFKSSFKINVWL